MRYLGLNVVPFATALSSKHFVPGIPSASHGNEVVVVCMGSVNRTSCPVCLHTTCLYDSYAQVRPRNGRRRAHTALYGAVNKPGGAPAKEASNPVPRGVDPRSPVGKLRLVNVQMYSNPYLPAYIPCGQLLLVQQPWLPSHHLAVLAAPFAIMALPELTYLHLLPSNRSYCVFCAGEPWRCIRGAPACDPPLHRRPKLTCSLRICELCVSAIRR